MENPPESSGCEMAILGQQVRDTSDEILKALLGDKALSKRIELESMKALWGMFDNPEITPDRLATLFNRLGLLGAGLDPDNTPDADCDSFLDRINLERADEVMFLMGVKCKLTEALPAFSFMAYLIGKLASQGEL